MKKLLSLLTVLFIFMLSCSMTRVIEQTANSAVIQGVGTTKYEAKANALKKGKELLGKVKETKQADCSQEYNVEGEGNQDSAKVSGTTYWSCVVYVEKE